MYTAVRIRHLLIVLGLLVLSYVNSLSHPSSNKVDGACLTSYDSAGRVQLSRACWLGCPVPSIPMSESAFYVRGLVLGGGGVKEFKFHLAGQ